MFTARLCCLDEAIAAYRAAVRLNPNEPRYHSNLLMMLNLHADFDPSEIHVECQRWNRQHAERLMLSTQQHANNPQHDRRLRVGYISPDFLEHPASSFVVPLLSNHDHRQFEIFCYANVDALISSPSGCVRDADVWRSTVGRSDQELASLVREDQIDILVDLAMHTANNRLLVFARKPAPVQVTWLAYPGTTGLSAIDYRLTDPHLDPPGLFDASYSEQSVRLPATFWCYDPLIDTPAVSAVPALGANVVTFGCLNNFCKVNDTVLALWARALHAVPRSRLFLLAPDGHARGRMSGPSSSRKGSNYRAWSLPTDGRVRIISGFTTGSTFASIPSPATAAPRPWTHFGWACPPSRW